MSGRYFLALVALGGLVASQSSSALTVIIDGTPYTDVEKVVIEGDTGGGGTGGGGTGGGGTGGGGTGGGGTGSGSNGCAPSDINKLFWQPLRMTGRVRRNFNRGEAYAFKFTLKEGQSGLIAYGATPGKGNGYTLKLFTVAPCAGQFDVKEILKQPGGEFCGALGKEGGINVSTTARKGYCPLEPGKPYYVNIRNYNFSTKKDTCSTGELCGFSLNSTIR